MNISIVYNIFSLAFFDRMVEAISGNPEIIKFKEDSRIISINEIGS